MIPVKPHYTHIVKTLIRLFEKGLLPNVEAISVEPDYGFVAQIKYHNKSARYIHGASVDVNTNGATFIARDKAHAKRFMRELGYHTPAGRAFVLPKYLAELKPFLESYGIDETSTFSAVPRYITQEIGFPCFIKPNDGYRGVDVYQCWTMAEVDTVLSIMETRCLELIIVEAAATLPEYRVVVFDGEVIACYSKVPLSVIGDGHSTIQSLIDTAQQAMTQVGRKFDFDQLRPQIERRLSKNNLDLSTVLPAGEALQVLDTANLSTGGKTEDYSPLLHPHWGGLCVQLSRDMNLRLVGIDFMCEDITRADADYTIIEINASPSLSNYFTIGEVQAQRVDALYQRIFNTPP